MERFTIKNLRLKVEHMNEYVITSSEFKVKIVPQYGAYYLYLQRRDEDTRTVRMLFAGTARECGYYLEGIKAAFWFVDLTNDLPF